MHPLNPYLNNKPDFKVLAEKYPYFAPYVTYSDSGNGSIDFADPSALRALTGALLKHDWDLDVELREDRLCPTLSNRLDYALSVLDLEPYLTSGGPSHTSKAPSLKDDTSRIRILDIGTGHVAIYPILLHRLRPQTFVCGTEINDISLKHARGVLQKNQIPETSIKLLKAPEDGDIFFALRDEPFDVAMCNPPFFASEEEMREGREFKSPSTSAVVTASSNESICAGGEVEFVSRMISESTRLQDRATWFTSLIGKYASLASLVDILKSFKIDNYYLKSIKQARTTRWIIMWSYTHARLPDSHTRPENLMGHTTFAKLLPLPNRLTHAPLHPPLPLDKLREAIIPALAECQLDPSSSDRAVHDEAGGIHLMPKGNTWSRAARRAAARQAETTVEGSMAIDPTKTKDTDSGEPVISMRLSFLPPVPPSASKPSTVPGSASQAAIEGTVPDVELGSSTHGAWQGATLALDFLQGNDRALFESFWKYLLTKANLLGKQGDGTTVGDGAEKRAADGDARGRGKGRIRVGFAARGARGRGRARDGGWRGSGLGAS